MSDTMPYVSANYLSGEYQPQALTIVSQKISSSQPAYFSDEAEFLIITAGSARLEINRQSISLVAGEIIELMPYQMQQLTLQTNQTVDLFRVRMGMGLPLLSSTDENNYAEALKRTEQYYPIIRVTASELNFLAQFCQEVIRQKQLSNNGTPSLNLAVASYLLHLFQTGVKLPSPHEDVDPAWQWLKYLTFHHQSNISLSKLAALFGASEEQIQRGLKAISGFTFDQLLNQVRIRNATALLQFSELTVRQIANVCGFHSIGTFYYQFQRTHRLLPGAYRAQLKVNHQLIGVSDGWVIGVYLLEHCSEPLTVAQIAEHFNFSIDTVSDRLQKQFGLTFNPLLNLFRCKLARPLVLASSLTIEQIAVKAGYHDAASFVRNYQKVWLLTPTADRQKYTKRA
ncbi:helix-turn-helix domain-containing protein [Secundilactobacillus folii]|nr:AraC family transcriptional regulator [Secundilactobacillus folii]